MKTHELCILLIICTQNTFLPHTLLPSMHMPCDNIPSVPSACQVPHQLTLILLDSDSASKLASNIAQQIYMQLKSRFVDLLEPS